MKGGDDGELFEVFLESEPVVALGKVNLLINANLDISQMVRLVRVQVHEIVQVIQAES